MTIERMQYEGDEQYQARVERLIEESKRRDREAMNKKIDERIAAQKKEAEEAERARKEAAHRERARAAWIAQGGDPKQFDEDWPEVYRLILQREAAKMAAEKQDAARNNMRRRLQSIF